MNYILPRWIGENRGDLISRYGLLRLLRENFPDAKILVPDNAAGYCPDGVELFRFGFLKDLFPRLKQIKYLMKKDTEILWACGHDLTDESSSLLMLHMLLKFITYKIFGLKIHIIAQGAGPIRSFSGGIMASLIVAVADTVSLRDIESGKLISGITGRGNEIKIVADTALSAVPRLGKNTPGAGKVLGVNLRRWYHLKQNSLIPYEYRKRFFSKEDEGSEIMNGFIAGFACFLDGLIEKYNFDIRIIPMYGGSIETWEDDLVLGTEMKNRMKYSGRVHVARGCFEIKGFLELFRDLDFMIGMRLHSTILATALKVPSIHLAYSPKGYSYFKRLKMPELVLPLDKLAIEKDWQSLADCFELLFSDRERFRKWLRSEIPGLEVEAGKCIEQILLK